MVVWCKKHTVEIFIGSSLISIQFLIKVLTALSVSFADAYHYLLAAKSHDMATKLVVIDSRRLQNYSLDHSYITVSVVDSKLMRKIQIAIPYLMECCKLVLKDKGLVCRRPQTIHDFNWVSHG